MILSNAIESFIANDDLLRASALTYTVTLSIVPILALAFSVLKGLGAAQQIGPMIEKALPLGSPQATNQIMHYVDNVNAAALGTVGAVFLLITVISTMGNIERALNTIFHAPHSRSYLRRFSDYLSVLFTVPVLMTAGLALTALVSAELTRLPLLTSMTPYLLAWAGFFFLYVFFPYTKVHYTPALIGSFATAVLFQIAQWGYVRFQVGVAKYQAIYGAVATIPIFLVWTYTAWVIVLFGAELTAAVQRGDTAITLDLRAPDFARAAALLAMLRLAHYHEGGGEEVSYESLASRMQASLERIEPIIDKFKDAGFVVEDPEHSRAWRRNIVLCRAPSAIPVAEILRCADESFDDKGVGDGRVRTVLEKARDAERTSVEGMTLQDLMNAQAA